MLGLSLMTEVPSNQREVYAQHRSTEETQVLAMAGAAAAAAAAARIPDITF